MLNTAVSLGRLGLSVEFVGDGADDQIADYILAFLHKNNVSTNFLTRYESSKSRLAMAFLGHDNNATYSFHKIQKNGIQQIKYPVVNKNDIVLFGSFFAIKKTLRNDLVAFLKHAKTQKAIIIYDPNFREQHKYLVPEVSDFIIQNIQLATMVKGSNEDFEYIFDKKNPDDVYQKINTINPHVPLVYTANKQGVTVFSAKQKFHFSAKSIIPVSTIGAGDTFNAGIIYELVRQQITIDSMKQILPNVWQQMIPCAIDFSTDVCLSYNNYLSEEYIKHISQKNK